MIGDYDRLSSSSSYSYNYRSVNKQLSRERILDVSDLASLPKGRAVVFASGSRPTLVRTIPWMNGKYAEEIRRSIAAHDPLAEQTIGEAQRELNTVEAALQKEPQP